MAAPESAAEAASMRRVGGRGGEHASSRRQRRRACVESAAEAASNFERPTAVLQYIVNTTLISLRKYEVSRYEALHDTE